MAYLVTAIVSVLVERSRVNGYFRDGRIEINDDIAVGVAMGAHGGMLGIRCRRLARGRASLGCPARRNPFGSTGLQCDRV